MENKKVILIVEDEESLRNALHDKLNDEGFTIMEARNGEEGLKISQQEHPDLILLDIVMPKMDGITMLNKLRQDDWGKNAQVIVLTNLSDNENIVEVMKSETFEYVIKTDIKLNEIVSMVKRKLGV